MYITEELLRQNIMPSHVDHYGCPVSSVPSSASYQDGIQLQQDTVLQYAPRENAVRFEFWESNVANRLGLGEAVRYAMDRGLPQIEHGILQLSLILRHELSKIPKVTIHHHKTTKCGIVTFQCEGLKSQTVQAALWRKGFELSVVPATSTPLDSSKSHVPDLVRASITYINTEEEIFSFSKALRSFIENTEG
jgi:selenocysteine lyase/cysteine desulfurase